VAESKTSTARRPPRLQRIFYARARLMLSTAAGIFAVFLLPAEWRMITRILIGWDIGVALFLGLVCGLVARADVSRIRSRAAMDDTGRFVTLVLTTAAALASLGAILAQLNSASGGRAPMHLALAVVTILLSWFFTDTIFAFTYAHDYYGDNRSKASGLSFPGNEQPDYWDFIYFSFVIGMTAQVSDVAVTSRSIRRTVVVHGVVSFLFNAALLALTVNIAANAI